eukprot:1682926-Rhodomonas_salina.2
MVTERWCATPCVRKKVKDDAVTENAPTRARKLKSCSPIVSTRKSVKVATPHSASTRSVPTSTPGGVVCFKDAVT